MTTVLIIEDNDLIRENTAEILELASYQVLTADNGKKGVELALSQRPDIVICDIMMPVMDGYGVLHIFTKNPDLEDVPFIFLSAKTERADIRKGMESGADDYITKPFQESELLSAIEGRLKKAQTLKKKHSPAEEPIHELIHSAKRHKELEFLSADKRVYPYKKKQILYVEGSEATKLFFLKKGKIKTYQSTQEGKEFITGIYKEGDFFGFVPLLEETDHKETAEVMEDAELIFIPKEEFLALLFQNQHISQRLIKMLANKVSEREKQLSGMAYNSLRKRTADALLFLKERYANSNQPVTAIQISRDDIAGIVGSSTESLIRTLSDFKAEHLLDIVDGRIVILNEQKLRHLKN